jgi:tetratricopeptide (TPR) repeat protein
MLFSALSFIKAHAGHSITEDLAITERLKSLHPDSAYIILKDIVQKASAEKKPLEEALALQQIGYIFYHHGSFNQALENYLKADKLLQTVNRKDQLARNLNQIGNLYYANREKSIANQYYYQALKIYHSIADTAGLAETYGLIGHICEKTDKSDSSLYYQRLALGFYKAVNNKDGIADIFENIASVFEDLSQFDSSFSYYNKALELYHSNNDVIAQISIRNNLGDVFRKTGKYKDGLEQTRIALQLALQTGELSQINSAYNDISKVYNLMGMNDSAYYYNALSRKALLAIYTSDNGKQIAFTQALYDTEHKNAEIQRLENERRIEKIITIAAVIIILLILMLALTIIKKQKLDMATQSRINEQEKLIYEANKAVMETDLHNKKLLEESLKNELEARGSELAAHTLHVIHKNQLLETLKTDIEALINDEKRDNKKQLRSILQQINKSYNNDTYWNKLNSIFEQVHQSFFDNLNKQADDLTASEIRLATLLKINLDSTDIATLLGISTDSLRIARYRLRKKLRLEPGSNLISFIQNL